MKGFYLASTRIYLLCRISFLKIRQCLKRLTKTDYLVYAIVLLYVVLLTYVSIIRYFAFDFYGWDLAVFDQSLWTTVNYGVVNGQIFWNTLNFGHLHIHFDPILFLILPIYAIYQSPLTLLFLQAFFLGIGAIPLYWLARDELESKTVSLLFVVMYLSYAPLTGIAWMFFPDSFIPAFLLFAFYYFQRGKWSRYFTFLTLVLMCKEIVVLLTVPFGFYGLWVNRRSMREAKGKLTEVWKNKRILYSVTTIVLSIIWFTVAIINMSYWTSISPWASTAKESVHLIWWSHFGKDLSSIVLGMILNPVNTFNILVAHLTSSYPYLLMLFAPLAFVSLLNPSTVLIGVPYMLWFLLSSEPLFWTFSLHYVAPILPFIFLSAVYGAKRLSKLHVRVTQDMLLLRSVRTPKHDILKTVVVVMVIINILSTTFHQSTVNWYTYEAEQGGYAMTLHRQALQEVLALIPPNASVLTQNNLLTHLAHRLQAYPGWREDLPQVDYVIVDTTLTWSFQYAPGSNWAYEAVTGSKLQDIWSTGNYGVVTTVDGIWLWKRGLSQNVSQQVIISTEGHGLMAYFYNNTQFEGKPVFNSVFLQLGPSPYHWSVIWGKYDLVKLTPHANLQGPFSTTFSGYLYTPQPGNYSFESKGSGIALFIDGKNIMADMKKFILQNGFEEKNPTIIEDDDASFWRIGWFLEDGKIGFPIVESSTDKLEKGLYSTKIEIGSGQYKYWALLHSFSPPLDLSKKDYISFLWYGNNSGGTIGLKLNSPDDKNYYVQTFDDNFEGWRQIILPLKFFAKIGSPVGWSSINKILIHPWASENLSGTWYLDRMVAGTGLPFNSSSSIWLEEGFHKIDLWFICEGNESIWVNWLPPWKKSWEILPGEFLYLKPIENG